MSPGDLFDAAGPLRPEYHRVEWGATPLGPVSSWSPALRGAVDLALQTRFPMTLLWGPEFVMVYNEAYVSLIGEKHPAALGARARDVFPEAWEKVGPMMQSVLKGRGATWVYNEPVPLHRRGFLEECFFTFSYSPVRGADGTIEGVVDIAAETTAEVQNRRRLDVLARLNAALADVHGPDEVRRRALVVLHGARADLPAVDIRLPDVASAEGASRLPHAPTSLGGGRDLMVELTPTGRVVWIALGPASPASRAPVFIAQLNELLPPDEPYLDFLRLVAAALVQALDRATTRKAERRAAAALRGLSEALQRSLLTDPPRVADLDIAVHYIPAAEQAHIGGDWYDAFELPDGRLTLVIGDVAGHDRQSAAAMAQVRNLLRGIAFTLQGSPGDVLSSLDRTLQDLVPDVVATAVVATVEPAGARRDMGTLRWSNAGHPAPVLLTPDGRVRLLEAAPDVLLGLVPDARRADHRVSLEPGSSVVFYTDGLVERRGVPLDDSLAWLIGALEGQQHLSAEKLCEHLLDDVDDVGDVLEDDIALLVLRAVGRSGAA